MQGLNLEAWPTLAFPSSQEQQMLCCSLQGSVPNRYWWLYQASLAKDKSSWIVGALVTLGSCSGRLLASSTVAWHLQMAHFLSVQLRRHPLLRLGASCKFPTIPKQKIPVSRRHQKKHPHTDSHEHWIAHEPSASFQRPGGHWQAQAIP